MKRLKILTWALALSAGLGTAPGLAQNLPTFENVDRNGDGELSPRETPVFVFTFHDRFDADDSGGLDKQEWRAALAHLRDRVRKGAAFKDGAPALETAADFETALETFRAHHDLDGAAMIVGTDEGTKLEVYAGSYKADTVLNLASASKWLAGLIVGTIVAETDLAYTDTLATWRPDLADRPVGGATLEQLMSFTAGAAGIGRGGAKDIGLPTDISFAEAADRLLENDLVAEPGSQYAYGSWTMQVGGIWAAAEAGEDWNALHNRILAEPLGLQDTYWGHLSPEGTPGSIPNPNLQGGAWSSPRDLARYIQAIAAMGVVDGRPVLNADAIKGLERDLISERARAYVPPNAASLGYGIGIWCEKVLDDDTCPVISSSGAWGTTHWVNRETGVWGVFFVFDRGPRIFRDKQILRKAAEDYVLGGQ